VKTAKVRSVARSSTALSLTGGVQDLSDDQLKALLKDLDSVEGIPSAEPETINIGVDNNEGLP